MVRRPAQRAVSNHEAEVLHRVVCFLACILRDAPLRGAPQDEGRGEDFAVVLNSTALGNPGARAEAATAAPGARTAGACELARAIRLADTVADDHPDPAA